jgi:Na+/H+ antiporter NhaD/arsenite permease-like protein
MPIFFSAIIVRAEVLMLLPFVAMLLSIAFMPLISRRHWERHYPKVAVILGALTLAYYIFFARNSGRLLQAAHEYLRFIALIGSLFVVTGGIHLGLKRRATPAVNCLFLLIGAILSNLIGTTGASMLLIRPWIRMNRDRMAGFHVAFFIFIVSNIGGCLTPIGDPPLFLGYIKGVPFWWVLQHCGLAWAASLSILVAIFYCADHRNFSRAPATGRAEATGDAGWELEGWRNIGLLMVILAAVFLQKPAGLSEAIMLGVAALSFFWTPKRLHHGNAFDLAPIREVAWLFAGIFATMPPALDYLERHAGQLGLSSGLKFFWSTGVLSATLDNAPTYLAFLAAGMGHQHLTLNERGNVLQYVQFHGRELMAISLGSVFFGAMTYIGNGPNLMVKSMAEKAGIKTPGFFNYLFYYALPVLLPLFILISLLFFFHQ